MFLSKPYGLELLFIFSMFDQKMQIMALMIRLRLFSITGHAVQHFHHLLGNFMPTITSQNQ